MQYNFMRFPGGKPKAVTFSYDDGFPEDKKLAELFNKYNLKCTFNLNGFKPRNGWGISEAEVKKHILSHGHEVAVHGYIHRANGLIRPIEGIREILQCRLELEDIFGIIIRGMAYPDSGINKFSNSANYETIVNYLKELDIAYSRSTSCNQSFELPQDWYNWQPTAHHNNPEIMEYIDTFINLDISALYRANRDPRLFYIWGHSFEFSRNDNWDRLDEICKKLTGKKDIWYATNMEIYDYVNAYNSLKYSADGSIVYNPALFEIWFDIDGTLYSIKPGETLKIQA